VLPALADFHAAVELSQHVGAAGRARLLFVVGCAALDVGVVHACSVERAASLVERAAQAREALGAELLIGDDMKLGLRR